MKKVVIYLFLTLATILVALGISYHEIIFEAVKSFPKDWILWYLIGTFNTILVFRLIPKGNKVVKQKKTHSDKSENK